MDINELENEYAKYRFEIDISKFVRSTNVVVYSTSPITGFYRDLEDQAEEFSPCKRAQHEITTGQGVEVHVPNLFLGFKEEFEVFADQREFSQDQRDMVPFHEEYDDYLNQLDDFGSEAPPHNDLEEVPEYSAEEQLIRKEKTKGFEECRKFAHGPAIAETKDAVVLYCMANATDLNLVQVYRRSREEEAIQVKDGEEGVNSLSGYDLREKAVEPGIKTKSFNASLLGWRKMMDGTNQWAL